MDGVHAEAGSRTIDELEAEPQDILLGVVGLRSRRPDAAREVAAD